MRHGIFGRRLSRDSNARKALLVNLANALFDKGALTTTLAKAKFARPFVEKLVTTAKKNKLHRNRFLASFLEDKAFLKLTREISPGFAKRAGGYTRIVQLSPRKGDNTQLVKIELLPWEETSKGKQAKKLSGQKKNSPPVPEKKK